jgi:hypothetical protein
MSHEQFVASRKANKKRSLELRSTLKGFKYAYQQLERASLDTKEIVKQHDKTRKEFFILKHQREDELMAYLASLRPEQPNQAETLCPKQLGQAMTCFLNEKTRHGPYVSVPYFCKQFNAWLLAREKRVMISGEGSVLRTPASLSRPISVEECKTCLLLRGISIEEHVTKQFHGQLTTDDFVIGMECFGFV